MPPQTKFEPLLLGDIRINAANVFGRANPVASCFVDRTMERHGGAKSSASCSVIRAVMGLVPNAVQGCLLLPPEAAGEPDPELVKAVVVGNFVRAMFRSAPASESYA